MGTGTKTLVERDGQIGQMLDVTTDSKKSGQLLLVAGQAGHGKSSLLEAYRSCLDHRFTVMEGACDPVSVPTPFAPLYEILEALPGELSTEIREGDRRHDIYAGMLALLEADPTVLILEDLQWGDEATLGLVRYLGRRLDRTKSILILSYRPEEIDTTHPLLVVLADLSPAATSLTVPPLTVDGVGELAAGLDVDPKAIHTATGGNPFFVEEVLSHPGEEVPATIGAAIMSEVGKLPTGSLDLLEIVALSPEGIDLELAERFSPESAANIDIACMRRLLVEDGGRLRCRHDLIRLTVDHSIPPVRRRRIHIRLLDELEARTPSRRDTARLAHHAVQARETARAIEYSLDAAAQAQAEGANRQARLHYRAALSFRDEMDRATLDRALLGAATVSCATNHLPEATAAARDRVGLAEDDHDLADRLAWSAFIASRWGNVDAAEGDAQRSIALHRSFADCPEFARAKSVLATLAIWSGEWERASRLASEVTDMAIAVGAGELLATGLLAYGKAESLLAHENWVDPLREAVRLGVEMGNLEIACSGLNSLAFLSYWHLDLGTARDRFDQGIEFAKSNEMDAWYVAMAASKAGCDLAAGDWEAAAAVLERAIGWPTCASTDCEAKVLLATLRCRLGDPAGGKLTEQALAETDRSGTYPERVMATVLAMEAAWLGYLDPGVAEKRYRGSISIVEAAFDSDGAARLDVWASLLGWRDGLPEARAAAHRAWSDRGFDYEAMLLSSMVDEPPIDRIFAWLEERGAAAVLKALRRDLRARGVRGVPPSPRRSTVANPAGLTTRQLEVLELLASGLTNGGIADRLYISEKTVGHHVSAILDKLSVDNRVQAAALATETGLV